MKYKASVSFESDLRPVLSWRGELNFPNPRVCVRRALEAAQKLHKGAHWRSCVVLLEKVEEPDADGAGA